MSPPVIVWLRRDLRLADNPILSLAVDRSAPILPLFILENGRASDNRIRPFGEASLWYLHHSLAALTDAIAARGGALLLRRGDPAAVLGALAAETGARDILAGRRVGAADQADQALVRTLAATGVSLTLLPGALLHDPEQVRTKAGRPFSVFTPFWKTLSVSLDPGRPLPAPDRLPPPNPLPASDRLEDWGLCPSLPDWAGGLRETWTAGDVAAQDRLARFLDHAVESYASDRDRPDLEGTSRLSPALAFGELSPRQVWTAARTRPPCPGIDAFLREVGWREFCFHLLAQAPDMAHRPLKAAFEAFPWIEGDAADSAFAAWRQGRTGYPIVDAGMRQLWHSGWMHNRVRMIAASFLIKDLLVDWRRGEAWFWDTLVDANPANNPAGWQWVAGCGADAAPFFRIFNPVTQGERFDPKGAYVRRWLPELAALPDQVIHKPWTATPLERAATGLPADAPWFRPIVDHAEARARALAALKAVTKTDLP